MRGTAWTLLLLLAVPAHAKRYLTDAEALARAFPKAASFAEERREVSDAVRADAERRLGRGIPERSLTVHVAKAADGSVLGRALFLDEVGKTMPITFLVGIGPDGRVAAVELVEFRESRGDGIARKSFREQFAGKTLADPLKVGKDIRAVTSSTMSCDAACLAVKKALILMEALDPGEEGGAEHVRTAFRMGAEVSIRIAGTDRTTAERASQGALDAITRVEELMSHFKPGSDVSRVNAAAASGKSTPVDDATLRCLRRALHWWKETDGAFDITVGPLVELWGFGVRQSPPRVPSDAAVAAARMRVGSGQVELSELPDRENRVRIPDGFSINLSAIAEGFAIDAAAAALRKTGITQAVVDGGGDLFVLGEPSSDAARIGVRHPRDKSRLAGSLRVSDAGIGTSGDAEKFFEAGGKRYSHIIDPRTGCPVPWHGSVTVVAPNATDADALSTALYVMGPGKGVAFVEGLGAGYACVFLETRSDGSLVKSLSKRMEPLYREE